MNWAVFGPKLRVGSEIGDNRGNRHRNPALSAREHTALAPPMPLNIPIMLTWLRVAMIPLVVGVY